MMRLRMILAAGVIGAGAWVGGVLDAQVATSGPASASRPATTVPKPPPEPPAGVRVVRDVEYARVGETKLLMDVYIPKDAKEGLPCVVYIHGGGWRRGDKRQQTGVPLSTHGYVVASINHRVSTEAPFPAQIEDCKGAIRFLRANAKRYFVDGERMGVWGDSSGGHLASLVGTSGGVKELEGTVGGNLEFSSRVKAVVDYFGPIDFVAIMTQGSDIKRGQFPGAPEAQLLGGPTLEKKELAAKACPLTYITKDDPPFLIVHGSKDPRVPIAQSEMLRDGLKKAGVEVKMELIEGAGHGFKGEEETKAFGLVLPFFDRVLKGK